MYHIKSYSLYVDDSEKNSTVENRLHVSQQVKDIIIAIGFVNDIKYVLALGDLLKHKDIEVRRAGITAPRNIGQDLATPGAPLKNLSEVVMLPLYIAALDDEDAQVRYQAVWALSDVTDKPT